MYSEETSTTIGILRENGRRLISRLGVPGDNMSDLSFRQQMVLTILDKAIIGLVVVVVGFWLNLQLQNTKRAQDFSSQQEAERHQHQLELDKVRWQAEETAEHDRQVAKNELEKERREAGAAEVRDRKMAGAELDKQRREAELAAENYRRTSNAELEREQRRHFEDLAQEQRQFDARIKELKINFDQQRENERDIRKLNYMASQLSDFYWPLYLRLKRDTATWKLMHKKWDGTPFERSLGLALDREFILPNHEAAVSLIESHLYLIKPDPQLLDALTKYMKHVSVFKALRSIGSKEDPSAAGAPFPDEVEAIVKDRLEKLQEAYDTELKAVRLDPSPQTKSNPFSKNEGM
jgi:hypothetical protein